jgi:hypothetical protein
LPTTTLRKDKDELQMVLLAPSYFIADYVLWDGHEFIAYLGLQAVHASIDASAEYGLEIANGSRQKDR